MILGISVESVVTFPFSFLILLIWLISLFPWWIWLRVYQFCFFLFKESAFSSIALCNCFLYFIYFCSDLYSFFLLMLDFVCSSFSGCFRYKIRYFNLDFLVFFLDWYTDHYVLSFFVSYNSLHFKVYFVWYDYCYSNFLMISNSVE